MEERLLAALLPGPKTASEIDMAERTRRKWARILESRGLLTREREKIGQPTTYKLTRAGKMRAIDMGLLPSPMPYFGDIYINPQPSLPLDSLEFVEWMGEWSMAAVLAGILVYTVMLWSHFIPH
jgi:hypothetical protein